MKLRFPLFISVTCALAACGNESGLEPQNSAPTTNIVADDDGSAPPPQQTAASSATMEQNSTQRPKSALPLGMQTAPENFRSEHGIWSGRLELGRNRITQRLVWTPDGAIWQLNTGNTECRALFDDEWEGDQLKFVADDCPFPTISDRFSIKRNPAVSWLEASVKTSDTGGFRVNFGLSLPATTPIAKPPTGMRLETLGIGLSDSLAQVTTSAIANKDALPAGETAENFTSSPQGFVQLLASRIEQPPEDRPRLPVYEKRFSSAEGGFPKNTVKVFSLGSNDPDAVPFYLIRERKRGNPDEVGPAPSAERVREALVEKYGEPSRVSQLGSFRSYFWHFDTDGNQVKQSTCNDVRLNKDFRTPVQSLDHQPQISPGCGYQFVATIPASGEAQDQTFSIHDVTRIVAPLLYTEFTQSTQPVSGQRDAIIEAFKATRERINAVAEAEIEL